MSLETRAAKKARTIEAFDRFRQSDARSILYVFLTPIERVKLGEVDKTFYQDAPLRGTVEGIYGARGLTALEAIERVKEYVNYLGTPGSLHGPAESCENIPDCWYWMHKDYFYAVGFPYTAEQLVKKEWFEPETKLSLGDGIEIKGVWNMDRVDDEHEFHEDENGDDAIWEGLCFVDYFRNDNWKKARLIERELKSLSYPIPFNKLFQLMKKHDLDLQDEFLKAEEPDRYGSSEDVFAIFSSDLCCTYLRHLKPGVKFVYRNKNDEWVGAKIYRCEECKSYTEGVKEAWCSSKYCFGQGMFCRQCTPIQKCSTCGATGCGCRMEECCHPGCKNQMCICNDFDAYTHDEQGLAPGHSFVFYPEGVDPAVEDDIFQYHYKKQYCSEHAPPGSVPFRGFY